jgi:hypothetical protein
MASLKDVEDAIKSFGPEEKEQLISDLPKLLEITIDYENLLKLAETAFRFWDNEDDAIYGTL